MNIAVYCGSSSGDDPRFTQAAKELGKWIGENGHTLVYGGASKGLMGAVAGAVIEAGGKVIGVIPDVAIIQARKHTGLTELIETGSMAERKSKMIELADAFIAAASVVNDETLCTANGKHYKCIPELQMSVFKVE